MILKFWLPLSNQQAFLLEHLVSTHPSIASISIWPVIIYFCEYSDWKCLQNLLQPEMSCKLVTRGGIYTIKSSSFVMSVFYHSTIQIDDIHFVSHSAGVLNHTLKCFNSMSLTRLQYILIYDQKQWQLCVWTLKKNSADKNC